jgi:hypothetical protein
MNLYSPELLSISMASLGIKMMHAIAEASRVASLYIEFWGRSSQFHGGNLVKHGLILRSLWVSQHFPCVP